MSDQDWKQESVSEPKWNPEDWVWEQIRAGKPADLHKHLGKCDPKTSLGWGDDRRLSTAFLRKIFYDKPFADHMPPEGVRIVGAWFPEGLVLPDGRFHRQLWLERSRFEESINLSGQTVEGALSFEGSFVAATLERASAIDLTAAKIDGTLDLDGSTVEGTLTMDTLRVGGNLFMRGSKEECAKFADVDLTGAKIDGTLEAFGVTVKGVLMMNTLHVGGNLFMRGSKEEPAKFANVDLTGAKIDGTFAFDGATVEGALTMDGLHVGRSLFMRGSKEKPTKFANVDLTGAKIDGTLDLDGTTVEGTLTMDTLGVGGNLFMRGSKEEPAKFADVDLTGAKIDGTFDFDGATVEGALTMDGLHVGRSLFMRGGKEKPTKFADVDLTGAKIDGTLDLDGATVEGTLTMDTLGVGGSLFMRGSKEEPAKFADVDLTAAKIDGTLALYMATVEGALNLERAEIVGPIDLSNMVLGGKLTADNASAGTDLLMRHIRGSSKNQGVTASLRLLHVGASLDLEGATCCSLDLSGSRIEGELRLLSLNWSGDSSIVLRNTHAAGLYDSDSAWPRQVELEGLTYARWDGLGVNGDTRGKVRVRRKWYGDWFKKDQTYSPQPYEQLANVLRKAGEPAMAADVLYKGRERARCEALVKWRLPGDRTLLLPGWRFIGMTLLMSTIGYGLGLRYFRCLLWIAVLTGIGMVFLHNDATVLDTGTHPLPLDSFVYSFQKLMPLVEFEKFDQVRLGDWAKMYFYVHRTLGYMLAIFLGAGLTGLTQKS
jgi:uncharacterized protein YjbI with pentapeptide repeats